MPRPSSKSTVGSSFCSGSRSVTSKSGTVSVVVATHKRLHDAARPGEQLALTPGERRERGAPPVGGARHADLVLLLRRGEEQVQIRVALQRQAELFGEDRGDGVVGARRPVGSLRGGCGVRGMSPSSLSSCVAGDGAYTKVRRAGRRRPSTAQARSSTCVKVLLRSCAARRATRDPSAKEATSPGARCEWNRCTKRSSARRASAGRKKRGETRQGGDHAKAPIELGNADARLEKPLTEARCA